MQMELVVNFDLFLHHMEVKSAYLHTPINNTHKEKLCFTHFSTKMATWLLLTFYICEHNKLNSIHSIITYLTLFRMGFSGLLTDGGSQKAPPPLPN